MMNEEKRFWLIAAGSVLIALLVGLGTWMALREVDSAGIIGSDRANSGRKKAFKQTLVEGLRITRHGVRGVDLIRCGKCRLEKRKRGLITFGGLNVLVMEDLSIVLPPDGTAVAVDDKGEADGANVGKGKGKRKAKARNERLDVVRHLGISDGFLAKRGLPAKFSGVRIERFEVGRLVGEAEVQPLFKASAAMAVRGGMQLSNCEVALEQGGMQNVGKAMLTRKGRKLHLSWQGGEKEI